MMRLYRALLRAYPAAFRGEYGEEMCAIFAQRRRSASGIPGVLTLWLETLFDVLRNAIPAHWDILRQDLRYTARTLARAPGFTLTAILVSALGIGANTAAFTITDHVLIRPLPGFFATLGIPLRQGRDVSESDTRESPFAAVVSESFVRRYWPGENPLGRRFQFAFQERIVVGVVGDIRVRGLERSSEPQVYLPYKQVPDGGLTWYAPKDLVIRSSPDPGTLLPAVRRIIRSTDPEQPISDVRMLTEVVETETAPRLVQVRVLGAFAAIAFLLAGIGVHGLLSFTVSHRAQEIGVRIALGAKSSDILRMVLREGFQLAVTGVILGVALAYAAGRTLEALLGGVKPGDIATFLAAVGLSLVMTIAGSLFPALRAVSVDPTTVIRAE